MRVSVFVKTVTSYRNLSIIIVGKGVFICVNYSKQSKQLTRSLLQQMVISIITVLLLLLPQQTTNVGKSDTPIIK